MKVYKALRVMKFAVMGAAFVALAGLAVMGLWNWLMPAIFGWKAITWLQALGLLALGRILFGGRGGWGGGWGRHRRGHWREKMQARWEQMSDAEKAQWKEKWARHGHCGGPWAQESGPGASAQG